MRRSPFFYVFPWLPTGRQEKATTYIRVPFRINGPQKNGSE
jgi:hypothetical protein